MKLLPLKYIISIVISCGLCACGGGEGDDPNPDRYFINDEAELKEVMEGLRGAPDDYLMLSGVWWYYTRTGMYRELIAHALPIYQQADSTDNDVLKAFAGTYLAQAYLVINQYDSLDYYVRQVADMVDAGRNPTLGVILNNVRAIHAVQAEIDYAKALYHFNIAIEFSRKSDNPTNTALLLCNIAHIYYMRQDPSGQPYAEEAYMIGQELEDEGVLAHGTLLMAQMRILKGEYEDALFHAEELLELSKRPPLERYGAIANVLLGEVWNGLGQKNIAAVYYQRAREYIPKLDDESVVMRFYLSYGNFLLDSGDAGQARDVFSQGLALSLEKNNIESRHDLLLGLSRAYTLSGRNDEALEYYKMYHAHSDSIHTRQREQDFNQLLLQYEKLNHENEIKEKELTLEKATRKTQAIVYVFILVVVAMGSIYIIYRRRYMMYRQLVESHQKMVSLEQNLHSRNKDSNGAGGDPEKKLYDRLEKLMRNECVYRHNDISLEKIAEMLGSNRSYISRIINNYSGMSFYNYINSHRIREAVEVLSDPENDIQLKVLYHELGFNALSAFYRSFQKETGVPPSKYREEVRRMNRTKKPTVTDS